MKALYNAKWISGFLMGIALLFSSPIKSENTPAFPGAEGFGRYTTGGRGGVVYHVTSLADDGSTGTLRWALEQNGKRTIVFDVSGTIHLTSALSISIGNVTIAGQTAPGDGICVADYPFTINASNVIIRFIRFRLGNLHVADHEGDGLGGMDQQNIMVDHCSVSWSIDECCSILGNKNATVQWCIVSQSLQDAGHAKGSHGYGGNWGGSGTSYHHNLLCHHNSRVPRLGPRYTTQTDERLDMRNNVMYNWGGLGCYGGEGMNVNIVNNYYKPGPATKTRSAYIQYRIAALGIRTTEYVTNNEVYKPMWHIWGDFFVDGNFVNEHADVTADNWTKGIYAQIDNASVDNTFTQATKDTMRIYTPINYIYTTTHTAEKAYEKVLNYAGCSLSRDWVDALMVSDTQNGVATYTGAGNSPGIIDSQEDNKPANAASDWNAWPTLNSTAAPTDTDRDGMPDTWETANGLNPNSATDGNSLNADGFTMLEVYMNSLVATIVQAQNAEGTPTGSTISTVVGTTSTATLGKSTYNGSVATTQWLFNDSYSITNSNNKGYSTGSGDCIKFSTGTKFTVNLPSGINVVSVKFVGYDNYSGTDSYISELNGNTYSPTAYVFIQKDASGNATTCTHNIAFESPVSGSFTFTIAGNQTAMYLELATTTATGIKKQPVVLPNPNALVKVYTLDGRLVRGQVTRSEATETLPNGIYIIDGKKIAIFR